MLVVVDTTMMVEKQMSKATMIDADAKRTYQDVEKGQRKGTANGNTKCPRSSYFKIA